MIFTPYESLTFPSFSDVLLFLVRCSTFENSVNVKTKNTGKNTNI